jgi:hypothetical protein
VVLVGNLLSCLRVKLESKSVTPDTAFYFISKDLTSIYGVDSFYAFIGIVWNRLSLAVMVSGGIFRMS